jgi:hypothetical protein
MKKILLSTVACATMMLAANSDYKYEITPTFGGVYTEGNLGLDRNYANGGLNLGFNQFDSFIDQVEVGFLRSIEDVDYKGTNADTGITRVFTNLVKEYDLTSDVSLYTLIGAGVEFFRVDGNWYINTVTGFIRAYTVAGGWVNGVTAVAGVSALNGQTGSLVTKTLNNESILGAGNIETVSLAQIHAITQSF